MRLGTSTPLTHSGPADWARKHRSLGLGAINFHLTCEDDPHLAESFLREAEKQDTAMAAVVKLPAETVEALCANHRELYPVNYNCPRQISVSGLSSEMTAFSAEVKAAGGRALPLKVKGAFHSPFMADAAKAFAEDLAKTEMNPPAILVYSDVTAEEYSGDPAYLLAKQIASPVRWEALVRNLIAAGVDTFIEIGPGKTLTNMITKIDPAVKAVPYTAFLEDTVC